MTRKKKRKSGVIGGTRSVLRIGGSLAITLPSEFVIAHGIKEGDDLPFAADHIMKIIPMPEGIEPGESDEVVARRDDGRSKA